MAKLEIARFGGVLPSVDPRDLPPPNGQTASNLDLRFGDFRPTKGVGATTTTVTSGAATIHRTPSGTWLQSATDANFVNGQINDPSVERVYVTGHAAYPEAWQGGSYRRLGVRAPTAAPTVSTNTVDEFTKEDQRQAVNDLIADIKAAVLANITPKLLANTKPADPGTGAIWLAHGTTTTPALPTTLDTQVCYLTPTTGGVVDLASDAYLQQPVLNGKLVTYSSQEYWAVPGLWRAYGYDVDQAAISTAIKALLKPPENTDQLVPDATADQIAERIAGLADETADPLATLIDRVNAAQDDVVTFQTRELTDLGRAYALADQLRKLETAIRTVDEYFVQWESRLLTILVDYEYLIPAYIEPVIETRGYIYTYVTDWDEESAPSPASELLELDQNDTVTITVVAPPVVSGYGSTTKWRLYRSSTTNEGAAYQLVAETAIGTLTYTDSKLQEELQEVCPTITWTEPRSDMVNLCGGANGIMLGSVGNTLCACEPFIPYAWPREYEKSLKHDIVAIVSTGVSWIVATEGVTYLVSGSDSASLSAQELPRSQACVSKRSMVGVDGGAIYASPDGLCAADGSGVTVLTAGAYTPTDFQALTPTDGLGAFHENVYHLWLTAAGKRLSLHMDKGQLSVSTVSAVTAAYTDLLTDTLYTVASGDVKPEFQGSTQTGVYKTGFAWTDEQPTFAWAQVRGSVTSATVKLYGDGNLLQTLTFTSTTPKRVVAARARYWEVQIESADRLTSVTLASSAAELK